MSEHNPGEPQFGDESGEHNPGEPEFGGEEGRSSTSPPAGETQDATTPPDNPDVDQVVGARTSEQGTHKILRVPAKWLIRKTAERLSSAKIPDLNSGLRAFRREVALPYLRLLPPGFSCVTTITLAFLSNQHDIRYVPIDYAKRSGSSKFHFVKDAYRYILQVLRMVMYFNPLKVLMPPALWLITIGLLKGVYDMVVHPVRFSVNTVLVFITGMLIAALALLADLIVRSRSEG